MKYFKKLVGDRIYLSPRNPEDAELFTKWLNDFQTTDYIGRSSEMYSVDAERKYLEEKANEKASFCIVTLDTDTMIGSVSLERFNNTDRSALFGIFIGDENFRNNGYGSEATRLILDYGFNYLNLHSIRLTVFANNERAIACYKKCGFVETGRHREKRFINGKYIDVITMDILEHEFNESYIRNKNM